MADTNNRSTKIFVTVLLVLSVLIAVAYIGFRYFWARPYSEEVDRIVSTRDSVVTAVYFVRVTDYDSLNVRDITADYVSASLDSNSLDPTKERLYVFHLFTTADTTSLTNEMVEELAYTNPTVQDPESVLRCVKNGWIVRYQFAPYRIQPRSFEMDRTYFYMPKSGLKIKDIKL